MKTKFFLYFFIFKSASFFCQNVNQSIAYIDTYYHGEKFFSIKEAASVFHNQMNSEIIVLVDFNKIKSGVDSLDIWIEDLSDTKLVFKGYLSNNTDLLQLTHHNTKSVEVKGELYFNGMRHSQVLDLNLFEISKEGMLYRNNQQDYYDRISAMIHFNFLPKHFGIDKKPHHLKKRISVSIGRAIINPITPENIMLIK